MKTFGSETVLIVFVAKPKPIHIMAATIPKTNLSQYNASRGFMAFAPSMFLSHLNLSCLFIA